MDFSETIVVFAIKVSRCSQLNLYMNLYEYQRSRSLVELCRRPLSFNISNFFSFETARPMEVRFYVEPPKDEGMKVSTNGFVT